MLPAPAIARTTNPSNPPRSASSRAGRRRLLFELLLVSILVASAVVPLSQAAGAPRFLSLPHGFSAVGSTATAHPGITQPWSPVNPRPSVPRALPSTSQPRTGPNGKPLGQGQASVDVRTPRNGLHPSAVNVPLSVDIAANPPAGGIPLSVQFYGNVSGGAGGPYTWTWNYGDGSLDSGAQDPSHTYNHTGYFTVEATVEDVDHNQVQTELYLELYWMSSFVVSATAAVPEGTVPFVAHFFSNYSGGTNPTYTWNFGDGQPESHYADPTHQFNNSGTFSVELEAVDAQGGNSWSYPTVLVASPTFNAQIASSAPSGVSPFTPTFTAEQSGGVGPYTDSWTINPGDYVTTGNPVSYEFTTGPGGYSVTLRATDATGRTATSSYNGEITSAGSPELGVDFTTSPTSTYVGQVVTFTPTVAMATLPFAYSWDFGDGSVGSQAMSPTHVYNESGSFTADLLVDTSTGQSDYVQQIVDVEPLPLQAEFNVTQTPGAINYDVSLSARVAGGVPPYSYSWDLGYELPPAWTQNVSFVEVQNCYDPTLTVTDAIGDTSSASDGDYCPGYAVGALSASATIPAGYAPLSDSFSAFPSAGLAPWTYSWSFGDGGTSSAPNPSHTFTTPGDYSVHVSAMSPAGGLEQTWITIDVLPSTSLQVSICCSNTNNVPFETYFSASVVGGSGDYTYLWTFGDGSTSTLEDLEHTYLYPGYYVVNLTVTDQITGYEGFAETPVTAYPSSDLVATLNVTPSSGESPLHENLTAIVGDGVAPFTYLWNFGDGSVATTTVPNVEHTYLGEGDGYYVSCIVVDALQRSTEAQSSVELSGSTVAVEAVAETPSGSAPLTVPFKAVISGGVAPFHVVWRFGDNGVPSSYLDPTHQYNASGYYEAYVDVYSANGGTASAGVQVDVTQFTSGDTFTPTIAANPVVATTGQSVDFSSFVPPVSGPYSYYWNFDDGSTSSVADPTHAYGSVGTYQVTLFVTAGDAAWGRTTVEIQVVSSPSLYCSIDASAFSGAAPLPVDFTALVGGGDGAYGYAWSFGDNSPGSAAADPEHLYNASGGYWAELAVSDGLLGSTGCSAYIDLSANELAVSYSVNPGAPAPGSPATFTAYASGGVAPYTYAWNFGDGSAIASGPSVTHAFTAGDFYVELTVADSAGDHSSDYQWVYVDAPPLSITAWGSFAAGNTPFGVQFLQNTTGGIAPYQWSWTFGDGGSAAGPDPQHVYEAAGAYEVRVQVTDSTGTTNAAQFTIEALGAEGTLNVVASTSNPSGPAPLTTSFTSIVSGGIPPYTYSWDFGDGSAPSALANPTHTYTTDEEEDAEVTVTDAIGDTGSAYVEVFSYALELSAQISATYISGQAPLTTTFTGSAEGGIGPYTYSWDFGDGAYGEGPNPTHTFAEGTYSTTLTVTDALGDTAYAELTISAGSGTVPLAAAIEASATSSSLPATVDFTGIAWGGTGPYTYAWYFDDGSPESTAQNPTHTFDTQGEFEVELTVQDSNGTTADAYLEVEVSSIPLLASIVPSSAGGPAPLSETFLAHVDGGIPPYSYAWQFGDGATSTAAAPTHTYTTIGEYQVELTVTDSVSDTYQADVSVVLGPSSLVAAGVLSATAGVAPLPVEFSSWAEGGTGPYTYQWNFGDGTSASARYANHTYSQTGTYTALLQVEDSDGSVALFAQAVTVSPELTSSASVVTSPTDAGLPDSFVGSASGGAGGNTYLWHFGDGGTSASLDPSHIYATAGSYTATLTVQDLAGDQSVSTTSVTVNAAPVASASVADGATDVNVADAFTGGATGGTGSFSYAWNFGDGGSSTHQDPTHAYISPGTYVAILTATDVIGGHDTAAVTVYVAPAVGVSASASPSTTDPGLSVQFTGTVSPGTGPYTYLWDFGDSATSTSLDPTHAYALPGSYPVTFQATDATGTVSTATFSEQVNLAPTISFTATPSTVDPGAPVVFSSTAGLGVPGYTYLWDFQDGSYSTLADPTHAFSGVGSYDVSVTLTDSVDGTATFSSTVTVGNAPTATLSATVDPTDVGTSVGLSATLSNGVGPFAYVWSFGDGSPTSTLSGPSHTYTSTGTFTVTLSATDSQGAIATATLTEVVNAVPSASISVGPDPTDAGVAVGFTAAVSGGTGTYTYSWDFGDGTPASTLAAPTHTYASHGTYTATLTVTDAVGGVGTATFSVVVDPLPTGSISASLSTADVGLPIGFSAVLSGGTGGYSYSWNFGDGSPASTASHPSHSYTSAGTYTVVLTATDALAQSATLTTSVTVVPSPSVVVTATPTGTDAGSPVVFSSTVTGGVGGVSYAWSFGDGGTSAAADPTHTYTAPGSFVATLVATDALGVSGTATVGVTVNAPPTASASASVSATDAGLAVAFAGGATLGTGAYSWSWNFGDGSPVSTQQDPSHVYASSGTYTATLTVSDASGGTAVASVTVLVNAVLTVAAHASATSAEVGAPVDLTSSLTGGTGTVALLWSFGDGGQSTAPDPSHIYRAPGTYQVWLNATDQVGGTASAVPLTINVVSGPSVVAAASSNPADVGATVDFTSTLTGGSGTANYLWTFGDGTTSALATPEHAYLAAGTYTVSLAVEDAAGDWANASLTLVVEADPVISATASSTLLDAGGSVDFTTSVAGGVGPFAYAWSFGDGGTSSAAAPSHTFATAGTFDVSVTLTDADGLSSVAHATITVDALPSLTVTANPASLHVGEGLSLAATVSGGTGPFTFVWSGLPTGCTAPAATDAAFGCSPTATGSFTVSVTATDADGHSATQTTTVVVAAAPAPNSATSLFGSSGSGAELGLLALVVLLAVVLLVAILRGRKGSGGGVRESASGSGTPSAPSSSQLTSTPSTREGAAPATATSPSSASEADEDREPPATSVGPEPSVSSDYKED